MIGSFMFVFCGMVGSVAYSGGYSNSFLGVLNLFLLFSFVIVSPREFIVLFFSFQMCILLWNVRYLWTCLVNLLVFCFSYIDILFCSIVIPTFDMWAFVLLGTEYVFLQMMSLFLLYKPAPDVHCCNIKQ